jgi:predicted N-acetyltransferase YhbS
LYLDNLCIDFRLHGSGIGRKLLHFGQEYARKENLPIRTETTENNVGFYRKVDFYSIGEWEVQAPAGTSPMALTVLEWKDESG